MALAVPTSVRMRLRGTAVGRVYARNHARLYRLSGGRLGGRLFVPGARPVPLLLLTTVGHVTGRMRTTPLMYVPSGEEGWAVAASNGGHPRDPAWFANLMAGKPATVQVGRQRTAVTARMVTGAERDILGGALCAIYPPLVDYQADTERPIPVVVLSPAGRD